MGGQNSKAQLDKLPDNVKIFGLENFGATCYCNSVLQALYFCHDFRVRLLEYYSDAVGGGNSAGNGNSSYGGGSGAGMGTSSGANGGVGGNGGGGSGGECEDSLLLALGELFMQIHSQKKKTGTIAPRKFVARLKKDNELFRSNYMHQDAHEFLNFLLNESCEIVEREEKAKKKRRQAMAAAASTLTGKGDATDGGGGISRSNSRLNRRSGNNHQQQQQQSDVSTTGSAAGSSSTSSSGGDARAENRLSTSPKMASSSPPNSDNAAMNDHETSTSGSTSTNVASLPSSPRSASSSSTHVSGGGTAEHTRDVDDPDAKTTTWIHDIFQGTTVNETRCLCCETVTTRDENFLDLSLEISHNSSITSCLRQFSKTETLSDRDKFYCDVCATHTEATRRMRIKKLPNILALHLKRFKFVEHLGRLKKLSCRVVFPCELKLCNTIDDDEVADVCYSLFAVVVHLGSRPDHGHYIALVKSHSHWLLFDDDVVTPIDESEVTTYFGMSRENDAGNTDHGYILMYQRETR